MNIDIFGARHSRFVRRNSQNRLEAVLEATSGVEPAMHNTFTDNLAAALQRPVVKRAATKTTTPNDIGKNVLAMVPGRIVAVHKCENGVCRTVHVKKRN